MAYLRISTHPSILPRRLSATEAMTNVTRLLERPHVRTPGEAAGFWEVYGPVAGDWASGNAVPDAHLAALMRQHGVAVIYTRDRDLRRFERIRVHDPFA